MSSRSNLQNEACVKSLVPSRHRSQLAVVWFVLSRSDIMDHISADTTFHLSNPVYTLEKVVELWDSVFQRLVPLKKAEYSLRESLLTLTAAALPFLPPPRGEGEISGNH